MFVCHEKEPCTLSITLIETVMLLLNFFLFILSALLVSSINNRDYFHNDSSTEHDKRGDLEIRTPLKEQVDKYPDCGIYDTVSF